jgi:exodeoxyribonuclease-5
MPNALDLEISAAAETLGVTLNEGQHEGATNLLRAVDHGETDLVLTGPAGSGKTTLLKTLIRAFRARGIRPRLSATTGKAASRVQTVTGEPATTLHQAMKFRVLEGRDGTPQFVNPQAPCEAKDALFVDEASMVDTWLYGQVRKMLPPTAISAWSGDKWQLPPIEGTWGPNFDGAQAVLTTICRQALDSPILYVATEVREGRVFPTGRLGTDYERKDTDFGEVVERLLEARNAGRDISAITYRNEMRQRINERVRRALGRTDPVEPGDRLLVRTNHRGLGRMNGEVLLVESTRPWTQTYAGIEAIARQRATPFEKDLVEIRTACGVTALVHPSQIGADRLAFQKTLWKDRVPNPKFLAATMPYQHLHVDYGEALTVHTAQGSEFQDVIFVLDGASRWRAQQDPEMARRLCYTAATRAKSSLFVAILG